MEVIEGHSPRMPQGRGGGCKWDCLPQAFQPEAPLAGRETQAGRNAPEEPGHVGEVA